MTYVEEKLADNPPEFGIKSSSWKAMIRNIAPGHDSPWKKSVIRKK